MSVRRCRAIATINLWILAEKFSFRSLVDSLSLSLDSLFSLMLYLTLPNYRLMFEILHPSMKRRITVGGKDWNQHPSTGLSGMLKSYAMLIHFLLLFLFCAEHLTLQVGV
jgi:hypothetical protein